MKQYLLDTHALIWAAVEPQKLSNKVRLIVENPTNEIMVNPISFWEISLKYSLGKLALANHQPEDFPFYAQEMGFMLMPFSAELASTFYQLKASHHRDPFDRMLIHTALQLKIPLISIDSNIHLYTSEGLKVVW
jgi:PIN domain nuclease of toxin-antitoxin system